MADTPTPRQRFETTEIRYRFRFAGHPRVSRDPELLDDMLASLDEIAADAGGDDALLKQIDEARVLYQKERAAILEARSVPGAVSAYRERLWADIAVGRYRRNFAGKPRGTRDVFLLEEIRTSLTAVRSRMQQLHERGPHLNLESAMADAGRTIELARAEADRIRTARHEGTQGEQGSRLADLANQQFGIYQRGFAGQSRLSRHPPRLARVVRALEEIGAGMARLQRDGFKSEPNDRNLGIVTDRIRAYKEEVGTMAKSREGVSISDRAAALGAAANAAFDHYNKEFAGKSRSKADGERLNLILEELIPIALEMDSIDQEDDNENNERNLALVLDQIVLYQREWTAIAEAQSNQDA